MVNRIVLITASAALAAGTIAGCSSSQPTETPRPAGSIAPGTGQATVAGKGIAATDRVFCRQVGRQHTIEVGDEKSNVHAIVSSADDKWSVSSIVFTDVGGFTGSYWDGLSGDADVKLAGLTFVLTGTAKGVNSAEPTKTAESKFEIKANC